MSVASFGLGTIRSTLYLDTQQYKMALKQATGMTQSAVAKNNKILALQAGSANVGMAAAMGATVVAPMLSMVNKIQKVYEEYDKVLGKIEAVSKATAQEMAVLNKVFVANGKAFAETPTNMAKAGYVSAQAMFSSFKEMKKVAEASAKLRLASGGEITTEQSAESLTKMLNAFSLGTDKLKEMNDILLVTRDVGATSMDKLADSVGNVAAAFAQAFQGKDAISSFKDMMALVASGTQAGMDPNVMATGLRSMIARTYTESNRPKSALNALAVSRGFENASAMMRPGIMPFLKIIKDATGGHLELLAALGYERREMSGVAAILRKGMADTVKARDAIDNSTGAIDEASKRMKQTWWYVKSTFMASKEALMISFGPAVVKMLMKITEALTNVFNYLEKLPESTKEFIVMAGAVTVLRIAISALSGALQIMGIRWASIIPGASLMLRLIKGMGGSSFGPGGFVGKTPNLALRGAYANSMAVAARSLLPSGYKKEGKKWVKSGLGSMGAGTYGSTFADAGIAGMAGASVAQRNVMQAVNFRPKLPSGVSKAKLAIVSALLSSGALSGTPSSGSMMGTPSSGIMGATPSSVMRNALLSSGKMSGTPSSGMVGAFAGRRVNGMGMDTLRAMFLSLFGNKILSSGRLMATPSSNMISKVISSGNIGGVTNRSTAGFGMDTLSAFFSRFFGNRALTSGSMSGTPSSGRMFGTPSSGSMFGTPSSGMLLGAVVNKSSAGLNDALSKMGSSLIAVWKNITKTIVGFATTAYGIIAVGGRNTITALSNLWKTSILPMLGAGAVAGKGAGKAVLTSAGGAGAGIWAGLSAMGRSLGMLALKLASFATYVIGAITVLAGFTGFWESIKNNFVAPNFSFSEMLEGIYENLKWAGGFLVQSFNNVAEALVMYARRWFFGWSKEDAEAKFNENQRKSEERWMPKAKVYADPAQYFQEVIDKMVQNMSSTGTMDGLSDESREQIMREILTPKHKFLIEGIGGPMGANPIQFKNAALLMDEAMTLFAQLFEGPGIVRDPENPPPKPDGLPQWEEQVTIKLGEIAEAFTLGTAEAWKAIIPRYYVEEKTLKLQEKQVELSDRLVTLSGEIADNTARNNLGVPLLQAHV